jgi:hypothetical protein
MWASDLAGGKQGAGVGYSGVEEWGHPGLSAIGSEAVFGCLATLGTSLTSVLHRMTCFSALGHVRPFYLPPMSPLPAHPCFCPGQPSTPRNKGDS